MRITYSQTTLGLQPDKQPVIDNDLSSFNIQADKDPVVDDNLTSFKESPAGIILIALAVIGGVSVIIYGISRLFKGGKK